MADLPTINVYETCFECGKNIEFSLKADDILKFMFDIDSVPYLSDDAKATSIGPTCAEHLEKFKSLGKRA